MAEEEKIEQEVVDEKPKEEKKQSGWSKFWHKVGKSISDASREAELETVYRKEANVLDIYMGGAFNTLTKYGKMIDETHAEFYGLLGEEDKIPYSSVLAVNPKEKGDPKLFYITEVKHEEKDTVTLKLKEKVDDKEVENEYIRPLTILTLDPNLREVKVIKVKDRYFLKKEEK